MTTIDNWYLTSTSSLLLSYLCTHSVSFHVFVSLFLAGVNTTQNVIGWKDKIIQFRCDFSEDPYGVFWGKVNRSKPDTPEVKSFFLDGKIVNKDERFSMDDNFVLTIHDVEVFDEGNYSCQLETVQGEDSINFTQLTIYGKLIHLVKTTKRCLHNIDNSLYMYTV